MLRPAHLDLSLIGHPLPWDLFTESGVLVAGQGLLIADENHFLRLAGRALYVKSEPGPNAGVLPERLLELVTRTDALLSVGPGGLDIPAIDQTARDLAALWQVDADACLGLPWRTNRARPAVIHSVQVLFVSLLLADQLEVNGTDRDSLAGAALTMNLGDLELHDRLATPYPSLTLEDRRRLREHPRRSAEMLAAAGLGDPVWLACILQHHEGMDGSGYPAGLTGADLSMGARILRVADVYCGKTCAREYHPPHSTRLAVQEIFGRERTALDSQLAVLLLRRLGVYPPGTLVRLASREAACITRRGRGGSVRFAVSFLDARGRVMEPPRERDLDTRPHQLRGVVDPEPAWPAIEWKSLWGY